MVGPKTRPQKTLAQYVWLPSQPPATTRVRPRLADWLILSIAKRWRAANFLHWKIHGPIDYWIQVLQPQKMLKCLMTNTTRRQQIQNLVPGPCTIFALQKGVVPDVCLRISEAPKSWWFVCPKHIGQMGYCHLSQENNHVFDTTTTKQKPKTSGKTLVCVLRSQHLQRASQRGSPIGP